MSNVINIKDFCFDEKFIRAKDIKKIFIGIVQSTVDSWVKAGLIKRYKILGSVFYKLSEIKEMVEKSVEV